MTVRILVLLLASFFMVSCDNEVTLEQEALKAEQRVPETLQERILRQRNQEKISGDFLRLTLSDNPKAAQGLIHPDFTFNPRGLKQDPNVPYDRDDYSVSWVKNLIGESASYRYSLTTTNVIGDLNKPAVILEGSADKKDFKYAFIYKFKDGLIHSVTVYDSMRETAPVVDREASVAISERAKGLQQKRAQMEKEIEGINRQLDKFTKEAMERMNEF